MRCCHATGIRTRRQRCPPGLSHRGPRASRPPKYCKYPTHTHGNGTASGPAPAGRCSAAGRKLAGVVRARGGSRGPGGPATLGGGSAAGYGRLGNVMARVRARRCVSRGREAAGSAIPSGPPPGDRWAVALRVAAAMDRPDRSMPRRPGRYSFAPGERSTPISP